MYVMAASDLGTRIRRARERKRWSQEQLADAIGVGTRSVGRWERGCALPRNSIGALEHVLGVSLADDQPGLEPRDRYEAELLSLKGDLPPGEAERLVEMYRAQRADARGRVS